MKARQSGVDSTDLEKAQAILKTLTPETLDKAELKRLMDWELVTKREGIVVERCTASDDCSCNEVVADGEELEFFDDALETALTGMEGEHKGRQLFEDLVEAAQAFPAGSVWKAGGKFILSHPDRNQSPPALLQLLALHGKTRAAEAISGMMEWTMARKKCIISAVQVNLHANHESFHAQHRDIFGKAQKEKAGRDCTCSFTN